MVNDWLLPREERPYKRIKIDERFLLELRRKINDLEKELTDSKNTINRLQTELRQSTSLKERENVLLLEIKKREKLINSQKAYIEELESEILKK